MCAGHMQKDRSQKKKKILYAMKSKANIEMFHTH